MPVISRGLALGLVLAALCCGGQTAHAQAVAVTYWIPGGPFGFGGGLEDGQGVNAYGNFPSFDGNAPRGGSLAARYNLPNGWFIGGDGGRVGLGASSFSQIGGIGNFGSLDYQGVQFGYKFQNASAGPVTFFGGLDTLKYNGGVGGGPFSAFDNSNSQSGYRMHGGVEFQPTANVSLSLGMSYTQQPVNPANDIKSLTVSPFTGR